MAELVELVTASGAELFHMPDKVPYLTATVDGHEETYRLESKNAKGWLRRLYRTEFGKSVSHHALHELTLTKHPYQNRIVASFRFGMLASGA